jgi:hypothetical protein
VQPYKQDINHDGTYSNSEVGLADVALLIEELAKIYSTPTPKSWWCEAGCYID